MSWLRIDDGFAEHPKFAGWSAGDKWALLELLLYCARQRTEGHVPADVSLLPRSVTPRLLARAEESGWLDRDDDEGYVVHDWKDWNPHDPTAADRMRRYRERNASRNAGRNEARNSTVTSRARNPVPSKEPVQARSKDEEHVEPKGLKNYVAREGLALDLAGELQKLRAAAEHPAPPEEELEDDRTEAEVVREREEREATANGTFAGKLRHPERVVWETLDLDERAAVVAAHRASTGVRYVRGSHSATYVADALGTDPVDRNQAPPGYDGRSTPSEFLAAWCSRRAAR